MRKKLVWLAVFGTAGIAVLTIVQFQRPLGKLPSVQNLKEFGVQSGHTEFLREAADLLGFSLETKFETDSPKRAKDSLGRDALELSTSDGVRLTIDTETGVLLHYFMLSEMTRDSPTRGAPLSEREFIDIVERILTSKVISGYDNPEVSFAMDKIDVQKTPGPTIFTGKDGIPRMREWVARVPRFYRGFECMSGVYITANIEKRVITSVRHLPFVAPKSLVVNVSKFEAQKVAREFCKKRGIVNGKLGAMQWIMHPNNALDNIKVPGFKHSRETRLCWVVNCNVGTKGPSELVVAVDCETGKIVGGMY